MFAALFSSLFSKEKIIYTVIVLIILIVLISYSKNWIAK